MKINNVVELTKPETQSDMLHKAIEIEVTMFLQNYEDRLTDTGHLALVNRT